MGARHSPPTHLCLFSILFEIQAQPLSNILPAPHPHPRPLGSASSVGGLSSGTGGYQKSPVYLWDWRGPEQSGEWRRLGLKMGLLMCQPHCGSVVSRHPLPHWWLLHQMSSGRSSGCRNKMLWTCPSSRCREKAASLSRPPRRHHCCQGPRESSGVSA